MCSLGKEVNYFLGNVEGLSGDQGGRTVLEGN